MQRILIINGPNLNMTGRRETGVYGTESFEDYLTRLRHLYEGAVEIDYWQSNIEGEIVTRLQQAEDGYDGIILNAGGYTHTSVAIADAIRAIGVPVVEVHMSCILAREEYRHVSLPAPACKGTIMGFGLESYRLAVESIVER